VTLTSNGVDSGNDFGNYRPATISGQKFKDADASGTKGATEIGLGGWEIHAFGTDGGGAAVHEHTTTAADGTYSFSLKPGTYTVCETISGKPGWVQTFPSGTDCTGHTNGGTITPGAAGHADMFVLSGASAIGRDFGNTPLSKATVTFTPLADLPDGSDATKATSISCNDGSSSSNSNTLTTGDVRTNQTPLVCTITYTDP